MPMAVPNFRAKNGGAFRDGGERGFTESASELLGGLDGIQIG
jgi:hypothetical protein